MSVLYPSEKTNRPRRLVAKLARQAQPVILGRQKPTNFERWCRSVLVARLNSLEVDCFCLVDGERTHSCGKSSREGRLQLDICNFEFYRHAVFGGSLGVAEAYIRGYWECDDLLALMRLVARNSKALLNLESGFAKIFKPMGRIGNWLARNTLAGSKRNISAHYDLSNDFFSTFLDSTMTYSAGIFEQPETPLAEASLAKYERLCQLLDLRAEDHLLEIGTGWGGFASFAAREYGCRVTTTTISTEQFRYAQKKIQSAGLSDRVTLLHQDYRNLQGAFDKIVSIEMIEAVGHEFLGTYFSKCEELLQPGGKLALQAITIPDQRYERYRRSVDFIQRYVFPGGCLPSIGAIVAASSDRSSLQLTTLDELGEHYASTLARWRENFQANLDTIRTLGMTERLIRTWHYYFCYCEAAFREQLIGLKHIVFVKPS